MLYLAVDQVIEFHNEIILQSGGLIGVRDQQLLESAIFRMQAGFGGTEFYPDIFTKAAALLHGIIKNHPFLDANKRTAFVSAVSFLEYNGYSTYFPLNDTEAWLLNIASGQIPVEEIAIFLKQHCV